MIAIKKIIDLDDDSQPGLDLNMTYSCSTDPLCILMQQLGKDSNQWYERTYVFSEMNDILRGRMTVPVIEPYAAEWANRIKSYYKNKYLLNRFKNIQVSSFQKTVEDIISQQKIITENQIRPLLKLPFFYLEDLAVEEIIKNNVSVIKSHSTIDDDFDFINKICRFGKINDRYFRFLLQNSKKQLLSIKLVRNSNSYPLWNHLLETKSSIHFVGACTTGRFKGTQFKFYEVVDNNYSIRINRK